MEIIKESISAEALLKPITAAASAALLEAVVQNIMKPPACPPESSFPSLASVDARRLPSRDPGGMLAQNVGRAEKCLAESWTRYRKLYSDIAEEIATSAGGRVPERLVALANAERRIWLRHGAAAEDIFHSPLRTKLNLLVLEHAYIDLKGSASYLAVARENLYGTWGGALAKAAGIGVLAAGLGYGVDELVARATGVTNGNNYACQFVLDAVITPQIVRYPIDLRLKATLLAGTFLLGRGNSYLHR